MKTAQLEVADVLRRYGTAYRQTHSGSLSRAQRRVMSAVELVGRYLLLFSTLLTSAASDSADWVQMSLPLSAFDDRSMN